MRKNTQFNGLFTNSSTKRRMVNWFTYFFVFLFFLASYTASSQVVFQLGAATAGAITPTVDAFRTALGGGTVPGPNGSFGGIRREINWDGVPDALSAPNNLPPNFFNTVSPRGVVFATPGTGFQVSANAGIAPIEFGNINPTYPSLFAPFSAQRLFTALGSNITDVSFFVPGTTTPALIRGFGAVFSDVDQSVNPSTIQYFDQNNNLVLQRSVPGFPGNETFSFLGVVFPTPIIARVRITSGTSALGPNELLPATDLVVMDDFIYSEPLPLVVPCTLTCPANITVPNNAGQCGAVVNYPAPSTSGNCGTVTASPASGSFFPVGTTTVQVMATSGQTCTFTITVNDTELPKITSCPTVTPFCKNLSGSYTIPALTATDNCPGTTVSYTVTGATTRNGTGTNASGLFNQGTSTINWTVKDAANNTATCQTTVIVNANPVVSIPDAFALPSGVAANTVYIGYAPASSITLTAQSSGMPPYSYTWSNGSHASSITVSPTTTTTYTVTVRDGSGCTGTASKTIQVVDVRCGNKLNKVQVCQVPPGNPSNAHGICISANAVAEHLAEGSYLGACTTNVTTANDKKPGEEEVVKLMAERLTVEIINNPAPSHFTMFTKSNTGEPLQIKVFNALGSIVETRSNAALNTAIQIGQGYRPGLYYAEVIQGKQRVIVKLLKLSN